MYSGAITREDRDTYTRYMLCCSTRYIVKNKGFKIRQMYMASLVVCSPIVRLLLHAIKTDKDQALAFGPQCQTFTRAHQQCYNIWDHITLHRIYIQIKNQVFICLMRALDCTRFINLQCVARYFIIGNYELLFFAFFWSLAFFKSKYSMLYVWRFVWHFFSICFSLGLENIKNVCCKCIKTKKFSKMF